MPKTVGIIAGLSSIAGAILCYQVTAWWSRRRLTKRLQRGVRSEVKGEKLLTRNGFQIESTQQPLTATLSVGGKKKTVQVRPDAIVRRGGKRYIAEIKSGEVASNPLFKDTRRQLLEYHYYADVDGVLLVSADAGSIVEVRFPKEPIRSNRFGRFLFLLLLGLGTGILIGRYL